MKLKRLAFALSMSLCLLAVPINVSAITLSEITTEQTESVEETVEETVEPVEQTPLPEESTEIVLPVEGNLLGIVQSATNLGAPTEAVNKVDDLINKVASFIIQVLSYFITAFLVVRVVTDICYIVIPFSRTFLSNGHISKITQGNPMSAAQQGGIGLAGQMSSIPAMGANMQAGANMGMQQGMYAENKQGIQWVSTAALDAVACEQLIGQNGRVNNALKSYISDMVVVLVLTAILLTLAITGVLTGLGFMLGEMITRAISNIGNMI